MEKIEYRQGVINAGECVGEGWRAAGQNYGLFLGVAIVIWIILFVAGLIPIASILLNPIVAGPLFVGLYYVYLRKIDDEPADFGMAFSGFNHFVPAMIVSLIQAIPVIIFQIVQLFVTFTTLFSGGADAHDLQTLGAINFVYIILGLTTFLFVIVIRILLYFSYMLIAEHNLGAMDAIKLSVEAALANLGGLILLVILEILLAIAGALACLIGIVFVMPVIYAADVYAYRQVFPKTTRMMQNEPPPPTAYGGSFGVGQ